MVKLSTWMIEKKTRLALLASFLFLCVALVGCQQREVRDHVRLAGHTMGTHYNITLVANEGESLNVDSEALQAAVDAEFRYLNQVFSTYIPDSELMQLSQAEVGEWQKVSDPLMQVLQISQTISERSDGAFDITIMPLVRLWGFGPAPEPDQIPSAEEVASLRERVGYQKLELQDGQARRLADVTLDMGGVAKGYGADWMLAFLEQQGFDNILVEIGGDLSVRGESPRGDPWRLAIEQPSMLQGEVRLVVPLVDQGMVTSGEYRNFYEIDGERFSHTIDPSTGYPVRHKLVSVSVIAQTAAEADAWATAISVLGEDRGMALAEQEQLPVYMILIEDEGFSDRHSSAFKPYLYDQKH
ncbi:FAD:protein FMN transferase [Marinimicrobium sp. ABcell2]|uniref:FAD:protein FMN transferase n=1 Tax=Marinimicrobium sp. ABcell2 TaxID=3069751 RepID=UPI0027B0101F|nr:FAD:protein FMN transferase [Marinimicrobium sp. ABcell2]MDQ2075595.1 FAD:protein FMN transferase [Marinimicrobium sp. ABcell2]